jgi:hypothetical protein
MMVLHHGDSLAKLRRSEHDEILDVSIDGSFGHSVATIDDIHRNRLPHRGSFMFVVSKGHILLTKRNNRTMILPDCWTFAGEHVHAHETYEAAAIRGLREEFPSFYPLLKNGPLRQNSSVKLHGLQPNSPDLLEIDYPSINRADLQWIRYFLFIFEEDLLQNRFEPGELSNFQWIKLEKGALRDWEEQDTSNKLCDVPVKYWAGSALSRQPGGVKGRAMAPSLRNTTYSQLTRAMFRIAGSFVQSTAHVSQYL